MFTGKNMYIVYGIIALILILIIWKYTKKNNVRPVMLRVPAKFDNEIVKVEPIGEPLKQEEDINSLVKYDVSRVIYSSMPWVERFGNKVVKTEIIPLKLVSENEKSLLPVRRDVNNALYDYNPSSYAKIIPNFWILSGVDKYEYFNVVSDLEKYNTEYIKNPDIYSKIVFNNLQRVKTSLVETDYKPVESKRVATPVNTISSLYLLFTNSQDKKISSAGSYKLRYGKMSYNKDKKQVENTFSISTPVEINLVDGQDEVLLEIEPVKLYDEITGKINSIFYMEIRREITNVKQDPFVYISEILFNFKNNFVDAKEQLLIRENTNEQRNALLAWESREKKMKLDEVQMEASKTN